MIVADTNLIAYFLFLLPGEHTDAANQVYARDVDWLAPPLWRSEFLNVLALYIRQDLLSLPSAQAIFKDAAALLREARPNSDHVLDLTVRHGLSAYDASFAAVAAHHGVPLVTADRGILAACPGLAVSPEAFVTAP